MFAPGYVDHKASIGELEFSDSFAIHEGIGFYEEVNHFWWFVVGEGLVVDAEFAFEKCFVDGVVAECFGDHVGDECAEEESVE